MEAGIQTAGMSLQLSAGKEEADILIRNFNITRDINDAKKQGLGFLAQQLEFQKTLQGVMDMELRAKRLIAHQSTKDDTAAVKVRQGGGSQEGMDLAILQSKLKAQQTLAIVLLDQRARSVAALEVEKTKLAIQEKQIAIAERMAGITERQANARSTSEGYTKQWEESQNKMDRLNKQLENPNLSAEKRTELETQREEEEKNQRDLYRSQTREQMGIYGEAGGIALQNRGLRGGQSQYQRANTEEDWNMKMLQNRMQFETDPTAKARIGTQLMGAQQSALERMQGVAPIGDTLARSGGGGGVASVPTNANRAIEIQSSMDATLKLILGALNGGGIPGGGSSYALPPAVN